MTTSPNAAGQSGRVDAATLRALARARTVTRDLAEELLTHLPDVGDLPTQRALDHWVEQAADSLRALSESMEERLIDVGNGAGNDAGHAGRPSASDSHLDSHLPGTQHRPTRSRS